MNSYLEFKTFLQEKKRQEMVALEKQLEEEQLQHSRLAAQSRANKKHLVEYMARVGVLLNHSKVFIVSIYKESFELPKFILYQVEYLIY